LIQEKEQGKKKWEKKGERQGKEKSVGEKKSQRQQPFSSARKVNRQGKSKEEADPPGNS